ncbi:MAG TPA: FABP family protein [Acidimicrobiia bacterium]|nr:FABP family protein [Acidimicrobiia bacterium]
MATLPGPVERLAWLLGTWRGEGRGEYPAIDDFDYVEETTFACPGKPFVAYSQRTRTPEGEPLHAETGYLRPVGDGLVEAVIAEPIGVVELYEGRVLGERLELVSAHVATTPTAKDITGLRRLLRLDDDILHVRVEMEAMGAPMQLHLEAGLRREGS